MGGEGAGGSVSVKESVWKRVCVGESVCGRVCVWERVCVCVGERVSV